MSFSFLYTYKQVHKRQRRREDYELFRFFVINFVFVFFRNYFLSCLCLRCFFIFYVSKCITNFRYSRRSEFLVKFLQIFIQIKIHAWHNLIILKPEFLNPCNIFLKLEEFSSSNLAYSSLLFVLIHIYWGGQENTEQNNTSFEYLNVLNIIDTFWCGFICM